MSEAVGACISRLKGNAVRAQAFSLPIIGANGDEVGRLVCMDRAYATDPDLIDDLTSWRRRYAKFFLTQFEPTRERTVAWLENVVLPSDNRILFAIEKDDGERVGHIGVCNIGAGRAELDNLLRGKKGGDARLVFFAEITILRWLFVTLEIPSACLHVFSNNRPTIALHRSVGFSLHEKKELRKLIDALGVAYRVDSHVGEKVDFQYDEMRLSRQDFCRLHPLLNVRSNA